MEAIIIQLAAPAVVRTYRYLVSEPRETVEKRVLATARAT
jgi:hypothetical protein